MIVIVRRQDATDYEAAKVVYAEAFTRPDRDVAIPPEVGLFTRLWIAGDVIDALSFTAVIDETIVGHVTVSRAKVGTHDVVAVGPIGVLPRHQAKGIGTALMSTVLDAADAAGVPLVVLLGAPAYYGRFGFGPATELGVVPPDERWGTAFQARPLAAYSPEIAGRFQYAPAFSA